MEEKGTGEGRFCIRDVLFWEGKGCVVVVWSVEVSGYGVLRKWLFRDREGVKVEV